MQKLILLYSFCFLYFTSFSQRQFKVISVSEEMHTDGLLDEEIWSKAENVGEFWQNFPTDSVISIAPTEIFMCYDDKNLYIAAICHSSGGDFVVPSLKRDFRGSGNDNLTLLFDAFNDRNNAVFFGTNPYGVKREGLISEGGNDFRRGWSTSWDNVWHCAAKKYDDYWVAEMAIPFSTLRFNAGSEKWSFNSYRFDTQTKENSTWMRIPQNQSITSLSFMGDMYWEKPLESAGSNFSFIPFVTGGYTKDFEEGTPTNSKFDIGGDAKIGITSGLNLDLTLNPDFSQVEVDQQITNLDRFEIFFPERRQFFLENADLFGNFGFNTINPFFSRRIGVTRDTSTGSNIQNRIYGGLRLSGKLNENWRLGVLNMQTSRDESNGLPSFNYLVTALQKKMWSRSNIGVIFVNKQSFGERDEEIVNAYNRVAGLDFNYANLDNTWRGKTFYHYSFNQDGGENTFAHGLQAVYDVRKYNLQWQHEYVGASYDPEVGFVRRTDYFKIEPEFSLKFYPQDKAINEHSFTISPEFYWQPGFGKTDHQISLRWSAQMPQFSRAFASLSHTYVYLFDDFDPTGTDSEKLKAGTAYDFTSLSVNYNSNQTNSINFSMAPTIGKYYNGFRAGLRGTLNFRFQPFGSIALNYSFNHFSMPHLEHTKRTYLFGPRFDLTFSKSLFLTTFVQYNSQFQNTNINARLQWRFAPVSDFFLVFTDNYFTGNPDDPTDRFAIDIRNRALVAKMTYWLNP